MKYFIYNIIYAISLRKIIAYMIILLIIWKTVGKYIKTNPDKQKIWKLFNRLLVIGTVGIILVATLSSRSGGGTELILTPFYSFVEAKIQPERYRSMLMNVFLFFPLGLSLPYALPGKWKYQRGIAILFALIISISIEFIQYHYQLGRAEVDDVICNTLGCAIGCTSYIISKKHFQIKKEYTDLN